MVRFLTPCAFLLLSLSAVQAQDEIIKTLSADQLEKFLKVQKIEFKKSASADKDKTFFYDLTREKFQVRLSNFAGNDLMLDCVLGPISLDGINRWNIQTKFSRASLQKGAKGDGLSILESNLDLTGGVSEGAIKQFIARFDQDLTNFDFYVQSNAADTKILASVTDTRIELILKNLNVKWEKKPSPEFTIFDFEVDKQPIRLRNYNGKELFAFAKFKPMSLENINEFNLSRKFIRATSLKTKDNQELSILEAAYDCEPGVTEAMVRHFILAFVEDAKNFAEYADKLPPPSKTAKGK